MQLDEAEVEAALDRLLALGVAEEKDGHVRTSKAWNDRLRRVGEALNREAAEGVMPAGNPFAIAVARAMDEAALPFEGRERVVAQHVLVMLDLVNVGEGKRIQLGFGKLRIPDAE